MVEHKDQISMNVQNLRAIYEDWVIQQVIPNSTVLEIGSVDSRQAIRLSEQDCQVTSVYYNSDVVLEEARVSQIKSIAKSKNIKVILHKENDFLYPAKIGSGFEYIIVNNSSGKINNPTVVLAQVAEMLSRNGYLIVVHSLEVLQYEKKLRNQLLAEFLAILPKGISCIALDIIDGNVWFSGLNCKDIAPKFQKNYKSSTVDSISELNLLRLAENSGEQLRVKFFIAQQELEQDLPLNDKRLREMQYSYSVATRDLVATKLRCSKISKELLKAYTNPILWWVRCKLRDFRRFFSIAKKP